MDSNLKHSVIRKICVFILCDPNRFYWKHPYLLECKRTSAVSYGITRVSVFVNGTLLTHWWLILTLDVSRLSLSYHTWQVTSLPVIVLHRSYPSYVTWKGQVCMNRPYVCSAHASEIVAKQVHFVTHVPVAYSDGVSWVYGVIQSQVLGSYPAGGCCNLFCGRDGMRQDWWVN
jgi:hypothetical protein